MRDIKVLLNISLKNPNMSVLKGKIYDVATTGSNYEARVPEFLVLG